MSKSMDDKVILTDSSGKRVEMERNDTTEQMERLQNMTEEEREEYDRKYWEDIEATLKKQEECPHTVVNIEDTNRTTEKDGSELVIHHLACYKCGKSWVKGGNEASRKKITKMTSAFNNAMRKIAKEQEEL